MQNPNPQIRVIVVDDHEMVAESFRRVLDAEDDISVVACATSVASGVDAARSTRPDVVVLDYRLPDGTGLEAAERMLADAPGTRIVLLTGAGVEGMAAAAIEHGCSGYLEKASATKTLIAAVRRVHRGEAVISSDQLSGLLDAARPRHPRTTLTTRELEVLERVASGESNKTIADTLHVSLNTVRTHVQAILAKLGGHSRLEAVAIARRHGLLHPR